MTGTRPARRALGDAGQAFPIYITAVVGILFLALAFFAVGQAGAKKNGAQTAADASALAAAQDYRDQLL
ncbi:pilus assembly protein TadG-related protein, partial [Streptomyces sp. NPDC057654]|uniref:pilus assembly protein TadG-related protein n=1 Tax=Streptomyces sp. NPDC057654 TaxID=3346196 RepID=UPI0036A44AB2